MSALLFCEVSIFFTATRTVLHTISPIRLETGFIGIGLHNSIFYLFTAPNDCADCDSFGGECDGDKVCSCAEGFAGDGKDCRRIGVNKGIGTLLFFFCFEADSE